MSKLSEQIHDICTIREVKPVELIKQSKVPEEYIDNLAKLKESTEYNILLKGSKKGLTAYQKPKDGIPSTDLSLELQKLLSELQIRSTAPPQKTFGQVEYDKVTQRLKFYAADDVELLHPLAIIDVTKFPRGPRGIQGEKGEKGEKGDIGPGVTQEMLDDLEQATTNAREANELAQQTTQIAEQLMRDMQALTEDNIPHVVLEKTDYDSLQDKNENTLYLIYEDDTI